jgi:hypothetical protein
MDVQQSPALNQNPEYSELLNGVNQLVTNEIDLATASGRWELSADEWQRPLLTLRVRDQFQGQGSANFAPGELRKLQHFTSRLHELKGAVVRVGHWRSQLASLYASIREWCNDIPGEPFVQDEPAVLREARSGEYEVARLVISRGVQVMKVVPVGSWIAGADGRVDLTGVGGPFTLLYIQKDNGWFYYQQTYPYKLFPLTREVFVDLAEACLDG